MNRLLSAQLCHGSKINADRLILELTHGLAVDSCLASPFVCHPAPARQPTHKKNLAALPHLIAKKRKKSPSSLPVASPPSVSHGRRLASSTSTPCAEWVPPPSSAPPPPLSTSSLSPSPHGTTHPPPLRERHWPATCVGGATRRHGLPPEWGLDLDGWRLPQRRCRPRVLPSASPVIQIGCPGIGDADDEGHHHVLASRHPGFRGHSGGAGSCLILPSLFAAPGYLAFPISA